MPTARVMCRASAQAVLIRHVDVSRIFVSEITVSARRQVMCRHTPGGGADEVPASPQTVPAWTVLRPMPAAGCRRAVWRSPLFQCR